MSLYLEMRARMFSGFEKDVRFCFVRVFVSWEEEKRLEFGGLFLFFLVVLE